MTDTYHISEALGLSKKNTMYDVWRLIQREPPQMNVFRNKVSSVNYSDKGYRGKMFYNLLDHPMIKTKRVRITKGKYEGFTGTLVTITIPEKHDLPDRHMELFGRLLEHSILFRGKNLHTFIPDDFYSNSLETIRKGYKKRVLSSRKKDEHIFFSGVLSGMSGMKTSELILSKGIRHPFGSSLSKRATMDQRYDFMDACSAIDIYIDLHGKSNLHNICDLIYAPRRLRKFYKAVGIDSEVGNSYKTRESYVVPRKFVEERMETIPIEQFSLIGANGSRFFTTREASALVSGNMFFSIADKSNKKKTYEFISHLEKRAGKYSYESGEDGSLISMRKMDKDSLRTLIGGLIGQGLEMKDEAYPSSIEFTNGRNYVKITNLI